MRRASKSSAPVSINPLVDFYNAVSLKFLVPAGGYDLDDLKNDMVLRFSKPGDSFLAMDAEERLELPEGEICYADGNEIITRHFVWKQSRHAILTLESKNAIFISEILGELGDQVFEQVGRAIKEGLKLCFGVDAPVYTIDQKQPSIEI